MIKSPNTPNQSKQEQRDYAIPVPTSKAGKLFYRLLRGLWLLIRLVASLVITLLLVFMVLDFSMQTLPAILAMISLLLIVNYPLVLRFFNIDISETATEQDDARFLRLIKRTRQVLALIVAFSVIITVVHKLFGNEW